MKLHILLLVLIFSQTSLHSAETDPFTPRYYETEEGLPPINKEINRRLTLILEILNKSPEALNSSCSWAAYEQLLGAKLRRPFQGQIEAYIVDTPGLPKDVIPFDQSVFKNVPTIFSFQIEIGSVLGIGFADSIHHNGFLIGADKFGHFIDEGYYYYSLVNHWNIEISDVLNFGKFIEYAFEGELLSGVYSYADLSANYDGYRFWTNLLGSNKNNKDSLYVSCNKGNWIIKNPIDLGIYIAPSWDEGMNCSEYAYKDMYAGILKSIQQLELKNKKRYQCPIYPDKVASMIKRYGKDAKNIINPILFNNN